MPLLGALVGGSLGNARGSITIDTSDAQSAAMTMRRVGQDIGRAFDEGRARARQFSAGVKELRTELLALSLAAGAATVFGLGAAKDLRNYRVAFSQLLDDEKEAVRVMGDLADRANEFGMEVTEVWQMGRSFLPILEEGVAGLDGWVKRAALLSTINPFKGTTDAIRALQEYMAGQPISLQRLFNIDPNLIAEAKAQYKDIGDQIDYILTRMGATEAAARAMADPFVSMRNELKLTLAEGFGPLLSILRPTLTGIRQLTSGLREAHPELLVFGSGLITLAAVGLPTILMIERLVSALDKLQKAQAVMAVLGVLGKGALLGAAIAGGTAIGVEVGRGVGRATGNEAMANANIADVWLGIKQLFIAFAGALVIIQSKLEQLVIGIAQRFSNAVATMIEAMGQFAQRVGAFLPDWAGGGRLEEAGAGLIEGAKAIRDAGERLRQGAIEAEGVRARGIIDLGTRLGVYTTPGGAGATTAGGGGYTEEQFAAIIAWAEGVQRIEADANAARIDATRQYEQQRHDVIAQYELMIAREAEDFSRERLRQEQQLQQDIAAIHAEAAAREAQWWADLQETIADLQADSAKRIEDLQEEHQVRLERLARDHRVRLLEAAARLDAQAIANEQRQYQNQTADMADDLERRIQQERENLAERIAQEQEAHAKRVAQARAADEKRIADMIAALARRQAIEDEDREIRLARMAEDHALQLTQMDAAQGERLAQIDRHAADQRRQLDRNFALQMGQLVNQSTAYLNLQAARERQSLELFNQYWDSIDQLVREHMPTSPPGVSYFQSGGPVTSTGLAALHGSHGRPEYVLSADTTSVLQRMLGGGLFTQPQLVGAVAGGGARAVTLQSGAISMPIYAAPGQSAADIGRQVRDALMGILQELTR